MPDNSITPNPPAKILTFEPRPNGSPAITRQDLAGIATALAMAAKTDEIRQGIVLFAVACRLEVTEWSK